jgi:Preprotein translocase subunit SecA (ATPase, RNA helicase)
VANVLERFLRMGEGRTLRKLELQAKAVNQLEDAFTHLSDDELKEETEELRSRYAAGESLDDLLPEAFLRSAKHRSARWGFDTLMCR